MGYSQMKDIQPAGRNIPEIQPQNPGLQSSQQGRVGNAFEGPRLGFRKVTLSNSSQYRPSFEDLTNVQNLIEWCILLYMTKKEVVQTLWTNANIEPAFTISVLFTLHCNDIVWQRLEEDNHSFFKNYYARLEVIKQIKLYNTFLEHQDCEMKHLGIHSEPVPNLIQPLPALETSGLNAAFTSNVAGSAGLHPVPDNRAGQGQNQLKFSLPDQTSDFPNFGDAGASESHQIAPFSPSDADFVFDFTQLENTGPNFFGDSI